MKIEKLNKLLASKYNGKVKAYEKDQTLYLEGELDNYQDIIDIGYLSVDKKRYLGVVNDIKYSKEEVEHIRIPNIKTTKLDNKHVDVLVIGAGISGCSIARELSKYDLSILVVDKENDVAMQGSSRNDGQIHAGVDLKASCNKFKYLIKANPMYEQLSKELGIKFNRCGQYVFFKEGWLRPFVFGLCVVKSIQGVPSYIISKKHIKEKFPNINDDIKFAMCNPRAGVLSPYKYTIAYAENAIENGAEFSLNTYVESMNIVDDKIESVVTNQGVIYPRVVINAAGVFADKIAKMANDQHFTIHPRKGTELILDKKVKDITSSIMAVKSIKDFGAHTKGGGIVRTIDENILLGPDAVEQTFREDYSTNLSNVEALIKKHQASTSLLNKGAVITYFSGIRASTYEEEYYIHSGINTKNIVNCAGIQSPGLTTAPSVAIDIVKMTIDILGDVKENKTFNPYRKTHPILNDLSYEQRDELIKQNPDYGVMVCRCEEISKQEIIDCLESSLTPPTIDAIKRRVRPGMGRCQGSFCQGVVAKIISKQRNIPLEDVVKGTMDSKITYGSNKGSGKRG